TSELAPVFSFSNSTRTAAADLSSAARSSPVSVIWMTCSRPLRPSLMGTPTYRSLMPYSPCRYAAHGRILRLSFRIASTISTVDAPGAYHAEVLSRLTISARSEEHTSELQSLAYLVCRLLLEKK